MLKLHSKSNKNTTLTIDLNDNGEVVFFIESERFPNIMYFVLRDQDLPRLYQDIGEKIRAYTEYIGSLIDNS